MKKIIIILILIFTSNVTLSNPLDRKIDYAEIYESRGLFEQSLRLYIEIFEEIKDVDIFFSVIRNYRYLAMHNEILDFITANINLYTDIDPYIYVIYGEAYWNIGDYKTANNYWDKALNIGSDNLDFYKDFSKIQSNLRQYEKSIKTLLSGRKFLKNKEDFSHILFSDELSRNYMAIGNYSNALNEILESVLITGKIPDAEAKIFTMMQNKELESDINRRIEDFYNSKSSNYVAQEIYVWYLKHNNNYEKALEIQKKMDDQQNANGMLIINFAREAESEGELEISLKSYQYILDLGKSNKYFSSAIYNYTRVLEQKYANDDYIDKDEAEEIIQRYKSIIKEFPNTETAAKSYISIAKLQYENLNDLKSAIESLENVLKNMGHVRSAGQAGVLLADYNIKIGDLIRAEKVIDFSIKNFVYMDHEVKDPLLYKLALIKFFSGDIEDATSKFNKISNSKQSDISNDALDKLFILKSNVKDSTLLVKYSRANYSDYKNEFQEALKIYNEIIENSNDFDSQIWQYSIINSSKIYRKLKDFKASNKILDFLITEVPDSYNYDLALYLSALNFKDQNDNENAIKRLKQILINSPNSIYLDDARSLIRDLRDES